MSCCWPNQYPYSILKKEMDRMPGACSNKKQQLQLELILKFGPSLALELWCPPVFPWSRSGVCVWDLEFLYGSVQEKPLQNSREMENILENGRT